MSYIESACEGVDACVFTGDALLNTSYRKVLKTYIGRWLREIARYESLPQIDNEAGQDEEDPFSGDDMMGASR